MEKEKINTDMDNLIAKLLSKEEFDTLKLIIKLNGCFEEEKVN